MKYLYLIVLSPLLLAGCASLSKEECLASNWQQIGYKDGLEGQTVNRLDDHIKACAEYGITPVADQYYAGRSQGLLNYCQPASAFDLGRKGWDNNVAACPPDMQNTFLQEYSKGREINDLENTLNSIRSNINNNVYRINVINDRINGINNELRRTDLSNDARTALLNEYNRILNEKNNLGRDNDYLQRDADRQYDLVRMRLRDFGR
jgi:hypothetical protein